MESGKLSEEFGAIDKCMDWLYAATTESPRPKRTNAIPELQKEFLDGRDVCGSVQHYLQTSVPSKNLNLAAFLLYSAESIDYITGDEEMESYDHGFLAIGDYSNNGDASFVDLRNGFVYLLSIEIFVGWERFAEIDGDAADPDPILKKKSYRFFESLESFLLYCRDEAEAALVRSMWDSILEDNGVPFSVTYMSDEEYAKCLSECLMTPVNALNVRNERGQSLLEVAKEKG